MAAYAILFQFNIVVRYGYETQSRPLRYQIYYQYLNILNQLLHNPRMKNTVIFAFIFPFH
jgi:hypothetical protein